MRSKIQDWLTLKSEQYNFFDTIERLFFLDAAVEELPTKGGTHRYKEGKASMKITLFGLLPVVDIRGSGNGNVFQRDVFSAARYFN